MHLHCFAAPAEGTLKPSSLRSKVTEQRERKQQRQRLLADLTAPNVAVETVEQLKTGCGRSLYHSALLSMLQAATPPQLSQKERDKLCQVLGRPEKIKCVAYTLYLGAWKTLYMYIVLCALFTPH